MDNHTNLDTLTAKMDALRAKGFNDDEINQLLAGGASTPAVKTEEDKEYIEQWNERVDSVHKYEWAGFIGGAILFVPFIATIHSNPTFALYWFGFICVGIAVLSYTQTSRIKEFFKKRP